MFHAIYSLLTSPSTMVQESPCVRQIQTHSKSIPNKGSYLYWITELSAKLAFGRMPCRQKLPKTWAEIMRLHLREDPCAIQTSDVCAGGGTKSPCQMRYLNLEETVRKRRFRERKKERNGCCYNTNYVEFKAETT